MSLSSCGQLYWATFSILKSFLGGKRFLMHIEEGISKNNKAYQAMEGLFRDNRSDSNKGHQEIGDIGAFKMLKLQILSHIQ